MAEMRKVVAAGCASNTDRKLFLQTTRWNMGKACEFYHGITALQLLIDPRQTAPLKEPFDE